MERPSLMSMERVSAALSTQGSADLELLDSPAVGEPVSLHESEMQKEEDAGGSPVPPLAVTNRSCKLQQGRVSVPVRLVSANCTRRPSANPSLLRGCLIQLDQLVRSLPTSKIACAIC